MKVKKIPERMCIVCRKMLPKNQMIRVVRSPDGEFDIDPSGKKSGRGAYICTDENCVKKCTRTKVVNKNFKTTVDSEIYNKIEEEYHRKK